MSPGELFIIGRMTWREQESALCEATLRSSWRCALSAGTNNGSNNGCGSSISATMRLLARVRAPCERALTIAF